MIRLAGGPLSWSAEEVVAFPLGEPTLAATTARVCGRPVRRIGDKIAGARKILEELGYRAKCQLIVSGTGVSSASAFATSSMARVQAVLCWRS